MNSIEANPPIDRQFEIYIVLSDRCNFSCKNCLNSSGPKSKRYRLSDQEANDLIALINTNFDIKSVHFSGGEPTLELDQIENFQKAITRSVRYGLTTNGWFGKKAEKVLDRIKLDELVVSYDSFHAPFITTDVIRILVTAAIDRKIATTVNFVYETIADLAKASEVMVPGCKLKPSVLVQSGRQTAPNDLGGLVDNQAASGTCPSLDLKLSPLEKLVYIPGRGFSPCCGPLAFDEKADRELVFSKIDNNLESNVLRKKLLTGTFADQFKQAGLSGGTFQNRCDACAILYGVHIESGIPAKIDLLSQPKYPAYFAAKKLLQTEDSSILAEALNLGFIYSGKLGITSRVGSESLDPRLVVQEIDDTTLVDFDRLYRSIYLLPNSEYITAVEGEQQLQGFRKFVEICHVKRLYYFEGVPVAALVLNHYKPHPFLESDTLHIGFIGYNKSILSAPLLSSIRTDWVASLHKNLTTSGIVSSSVQWFNMSSHKFHEKLGLKVAGLRVERRIK